jgi:excisionase family DNA binding protein
MAQVQGELNVGRTTVHRMIRAEELATIRIGRSVRIPRSALDAWLQKKIAKAR